MNDMDLLRPAMTFAMVVEHGSFRAAAQHLGLSPAYVSQMISELEARLGRQLLYRSTRKISLTPEGETYQTHAIAMFQAFATGNAAMRQGGLGLSGHLRITVPTVLASPAFAKIVAKFCADNPELQLDITLDDAAIDPVAHRVDLAIRIGDAGQDPRLARKLFETYGVLLCASGWENPVADLSGLAQLRWLRTPKSAGNLRLRNMDTGRDVDVTPRQISIINNAQLIQELLRAAPSFAVFPEFAVRERLLNGTLYEPLPMYRTSSQPVYALFTERRTSLSNARAFVDAMMQWLRSTTRGESSPAV